MKHNLPMIILVAFVGLVAWDIRGCTTKAPPNEKLIRAEEKLKFIEEKRKDDSLLMAAYLQIRDDSIASLKEQLLNNGVRLQINKNNYDKIKPVVINLDREQLRSEASRYPLPAD